MIQIIEKNFNTIADAIKFSNQIALKYTEMHDVDIIYSEKGIYNVIIKLYIDCKYPPYASFDLVYLKPHKNDTIKKPHENDTIKKPHENDTIKKPHENDTIKKPHKNDTIKSLLEIDYSLKFIDDLLEDYEPFKSLTSTITKCDEKKYMYELKASFNFKDSVTLICIEYNDSDEYDVTLKNVILSDHGPMSNPLSTFSTSKVDADILFNHIIETYKQRGYLFDSNSLKIFRNISNCISATTTKNLILINH